MVLLQLESYFSRVTGILAARIIRLVVYVTFEEIWLAILFRPDRIEYIHQKPYNLSGESELNAAEMLVTSSTCMFEHFLLNLFLENSLSCLCFV